MRKTLSKFFIQSCLKAGLITGLSLASNFTIAAMNHKGAEPSDACKDITQPANIRCASAPSAIFDSEGTLWLTWAYAGHVYVNYSKDLGQSFSPPISVNRIPEKISARGENRPKIQRHKDGTIYISWTMPLEKRFTGHIRFSYSNDNGQSFSEPVIVNDNLDITGHRFEALGVNKNGDVFLAWIDKRDRLAHRKKNQAYHGAAIYYTWSDDKGQSFKPNKKLIDHSCECCRVVIDFDNQNLPVILWRNIYGKNTRDHALVQFTDNNTPLAPERVSYDNWRIDACPHHGPDMSINQQDDYHLIWFNNAEKRHGLFYARRDHATQELTPAISVGDYDKNASHPAVIHSGNKVWLAWKQFDGKKESIWVQHSKDNGDSWSKAYEFASTEKVSDYPFLLKYKSQVYIQWQTQNEGFRLIPVKN